MAIHVSKNGIFRILALLFLTTVLFTLILLFRLVSTQRDLSAWYSVLIVISCIGCIYMGVMTSYVRAQRLRAKRVSEEKYLSAIVLSGVGAWEYHPDTDFLWCSTEYFKMLGYDDKQHFLSDHSFTIEGVWIDILHPEDRERAVKQWNTFFSGETNDNMYEHTFRLRHKNKDWIWVVGRSKALYRESSPRKKIIIGTHVDITEKIAVQLELQRQNQKLRNFAFSNAHHVRGPVARMLGIVELERLNADIDWQWYMQTISDEVKQLDEVIKSIGRELEEIDQKSSQVR